MDGNPGNFMKLKRGLPRESCDFCRRRKIKCDRSLRASQGHSSCSQCALRQGTCYLNDPAETRVRRGRVDRGDKAGIAVGERSQTQAQESISGTAAVPVTSATQLEPFAYSTDLTTSMQTNDMFSDAFLGLSRDNIFFLDQIFMGDSNTSIDWLSYEQSAASTQDMTPSTVISGEGEVASTQNQTGLSHEFPCLQPASPTTTTTTTLNTALHCYFKYAAPWLPIIHEDAFWEDYNASRASSLLISAIASRGIIFTTLHNKWTLQQRFASEFRKSFLNTRSLASDSETIRLDDLEALALMANFEYEDTESESEILHSNLGHLFLRHESLVLMTLQYHIQDNLQSSTSHTYTLAKSQERRVLLYWHVYGLDAFRCLDRKQISLIPEKDVESAEENDSERLPQGEARDYLDALFELARVARKILKLCRKSVKRAGVHAEDVYDLYARIYEWRNHTCPVHLRREGRFAPGTLGTQAAGDTVPVQQRQRQRQSTQLHRAVLWALEINCLMQIENYVSEFGIRDTGSLSAEILTTRVEYESLSAINEMLELCRWMELEQKDKIQHKEYHLVDLAPLALRNACAGCCFWMCQRGTRLIQASRADGCLLGSYIDNARLLRDTAAKASSHRDTGDTIARLDKQIVLFREEMDNACLNVANVC